MSLLKKITKYFKIETATDNAEVIANLEMQQSFSFENVLDGLLGRDAFLSRKDYRIFVEQYGGFFAKLVQTERRTK